MLIGAESTDDATDTSVIKDVQEQPGPLADAALPWETHTRHSGGHDMMLQVQQTAHHMSEDPAGGAAYPLLMTECIPHEGLQSSPSLLNIPLAAEALQGVAETTSTQGASPYAADPDAGPFMFVQLPNLQVQGVQEADSRSLLRRLSAADKRSDSLDMTYAVPSMPTDIATSHVEDSNDGKGWQQSMAGGVDAAVEAVLLSCIVEACGGD